MSTVSSMCFQFENREKIFFTGKSVDGVLKVTPGATADVRKVVIYLIGVSNVDPKLELDDEVYDKKENKFTLVHRREQFYECIQDLYQPTPECDLMLRSRSLPFSLLLPANIPPAFENKMGYVRYMLMAVMEEKVEECAVTQRINTLLSINKLLDNNDIPKAMVPKLAISKRTIYCGCISTGGLEATLHVGRRAFVPGENIPINAQIVNFSRNPILFVTLSLIQKVKFSGVRKLKNVVVEIMRGSIMAHNQQMWKNQALLIPSLPTSTLTNKVAIYYKVQMTIKRTNDNSVVLKVPITIGSVPMKEVASSFVEGISTLGINFPGPHFPLAESAPCVLASRSECNFVPLYVAYSSCVDDCQVEVDEIPEELG